MNALTLSTPLEISEGAPWRDSDGVTWGQVVGGAPSWPVLDPFLGPVLGGRPCDEAWTLCEVSEGAPCSDTWEIEALLLLEAAGGGTMEFLRIDLFPIDTCDMRRFLTSGFSAG